MYCVTHPPGMLSLHNSHVPGCSLRCTRASWALYYSLQTRTHSGASPECSTSRKGSLNYVYVSKILCCCSGGPAACHRHRCLGGLLPPIHPQARLTSAGACGGFQPAATGGGCICCSAGVLSWETYASQILQELPPSLARLHVSMLTV